MAGITRRYTPLLPLFSIMRCILNLFAEKKGKYEAISVDDVLFERDDRFSGCRGGRGDFLYLDN